jgi:hypothetical protein
MTRIDYVTRGEYEELKSAIRSLQTQSPLENSAVKNGRLRFIGGLLLVDGGGTLQVVGTLLVDGTSTVTGTFNVEGPWNLSGDGTITGTVTVSGPVTISGDVDLTGTMTVTGDITVEGTGRINVGDIVIDPSGGGKITFPSGAAIEAGAGVQLRAGTSTAVVASSGITLNAAGRTVSLLSTGFFVSGISTVPLASAPAGAFVGAIYSDNTGKFFRVTT